LPGSYKYTVQADQEVRQGLVLLEGLVLQVVLAGLQDLYLLEGLVHLADQVVPAGPADIHIHDDLLFD
jgi:hypothetical protein